MDRTIEPAPHADNPIYQHATFAVAMHSLAKREYLYISRTGRLRCSNFVDRELVEAHRVAAEAGR